MPFQKKKDSEKYHKFSISLAPEAYSILMRLQKKFDLNRSGVISELLKNSDVKYALGEENPRNLGLGVLLEKQDKIMENLRRLGGSKKE